MDVKRTNELALNELEKLARTTRSAEILREIVIKHFNNEVICWYVANNGYCSEETLATLASHTSDKVKYKVAERSENITDKKALLSLALSKRKEIKEILAQKTTDEATKISLLRLNGNNPNIVATCLRRIHEPKFIANYINKCARTALYANVDSIISNKHITEEVFFTLIDNLRFIKQSQVKAILNHHNCTEEVERRILLKNVETNFIY